MSFDSGATISSSPKTWRVVAGVAVGQLILLPLMVALAAPWIGEDAFSLALVFSFLIAEILVCISAAHLGRRWWLWGLLMLAQPAWPGILLALMGPADPHRERYDPDAASSTSKPSAARYQAPASTRSSAESGSMEPYWQCPECGVVLEKKQDTMAIVGQALRRGGVVSGRASCASCGAGFAIADVYGGRYDANKRQALRHVFVFRAGPEPADTSWYLGEIVKGLFLAVDGDTRITFQTTNDISEMYMVMVAMANGIGSEQMKAATMQNFSDKDGYSGKILKVA
jgi:hypothetical protein